MAESTGPDAGPDARPDARPEARPDAGREVAHDARDAEQRAGGGPSRSGRVIAVLLLVVLALVAFVVARSGLSRWWVGKVSDACDGQFSVAVPLGAGVGLACTVLTLLALREVVRRTRSWTPSFLAALAALVVATPLVITLLTVLGRSATAEAASAKLAREAPGFTASVLIGAIAGAVLTGALWWLTRSRRLLREEVADLRQRLRALEAAASENPPSGRHAKVVEEGRTARR